MKRVTRMPTQAMQSWACDRPKGLRFVGSNLVCAPVRSIEVCMLAFSPLGAATASLPLTVGWDSPGTTSQTF